MAISFLAFWLGLDHEIYFAAITHTSPRADKPDTLDVPPRLSRRHRRSRPCAGPVERRDHRRALAPALLLELGLLRYHPHRRAGDGAGSGAGDGRRLEAPVPAARGRLPGLG